MREVKSGQHKAVPTRLIFSIGGFGGPHYEVRWRSGRLRYRSNDSQMTVAPSAESWETFWAEMSRIGAWKWQRVYDDGQTLDGCQWELDLSSGEQSVKCFGSNQFPGGSDRETAKPFQEFVAAVARLVGQPFG